MNEQAMNCRTRTPERIQEILRDIRTEPVYEVRKDQALGLVQFELDIPDFDVSADTETLMFIGSNKVAAMVFAGPFSPRFSIQIDQRLTENGPGDSIEFRLFRIKQNQICVQAQQVGEAYWQPGAHIKVRFLRERYLDKTIGIPIGFEVDITKPRVQLP